jgi:hypothetical protein
MVINPWLALDVDMLPAPASGSSQPTQPLLPLEARRDPPPVGAPLAVWNHWSAAKTLQAIVNQPWRHDRTTLFQPASLTSLAVAAASQDFNGGPVKTFAEARDVSITEQVWAAGSQLEEDPNLGRVPNLLAQHLMRNGELFDDELVAAFAQLPSDQQTEVLLSLEPATPSGAAHCRHLVAQLPPIAQSFWTLVLSSRREANSDVWRAFFATLSPSEQLARARAAVRAGRPMGLITDALGLAWPHPDAWDLEGAAVRAPVVGRSIEAGMSFDDINEMLGPFETPSAMAHMELLFCTTWAQEQVRGGRACDEVLSQWGRRTMFRTPTDLRLVVFRDEPQALLDYEVQHGLTPEPHRGDFGRQWICAHREAIQAAEAGAPVGQLLVQHQLDGEAFLHRLEMASCCGAAGREVFEGRCVPTQAMANYGLTGKLAMYWLEMYEGDGQFWRDRPAAFRNL